MPLVEIADLTVSFAQTDGSVQAVLGISLSVDAGESVGIGGESGSGKSVSCMAALQLLRKAPARITASRLALDGVDMLRAEKRQPAQMRESGAGKTTTGMLALRLMDPASGQILGDAVDITTMDHAALTPYRRKMQALFQDSYCALDPMMTLAQIVAEPLHIHGLGSASDQYEHSLGWLDRVGLGRIYANRYPHELSSTP